MPEWLSTHPNPANRAERLREAIAAMGTDFSTAKVVEAEYLRRLDGMVYGVNPRMGFFRDELFLHPDLEFQFRFPAGWQTQNQAQAVVGVSAAQDAIVQLGFSQQSTAADAAREFFGQNGVEGQATAVSVGGIPGYGGDFRATTDQGELAGRAVFLAYEGAVYQLLGYGTAAGWRTHRDAVRGSLSSFGRLTDPEALAIQPNRLDLVRLDRAMTLEEFAARYASEVPVAELALINQAGAGERLPAGRWVKRVVPGR